MKRSVQTNPVQTNPVFSLLHPTARPNGWQTAAEAWVSSAKEWNSFEYVLSIHRRQAELPNSVGIDWYEYYDSTRCWFEDNIGPYVILGINILAPTMVNNGNCAALCSSGLVLVDVNDDLFPCQDWDEKLLNAIARAGKKLTDEFVIKVNHGSYQPKLITHPVISRAYFERIGPVDPRYLGYGCDDELTEHAYRDGVVIEAPEILWEHRHHSNGLRAADALDAHNARPEVWEAKEKIRAARRAEGFPKVQL